MPEAIARLQAIDAALPTNDGIAWFTKLYLRVTETVSANVAGTTFADPLFLARLDVVFANLYFAAVAAYLRDPKTAPRAWTPLFTCRRRQGIAPIQFAFAGMNAHINRDLPLAVAAVCKERELDPFRARKQRGDFDTVNGLLAATETKVKRWFSTGFVGVVDEALGKADDRVAMWDVGRARDAAWVNAQALWALRELPALQRRFVDTLDRTVGFAGRGLLVPV